MRGPLASLGSPFNTLPPHRCKPGHTFPAKQSYQNSTTTRGHAAKPAAVWRLCAAASGMLYAFLPPRLGQHPSSTALAQRFDVQPIRREERPARPIRRRRAGLGLGERRVGWLTAASICLLGLSILGAATKQSRRKASVRSYYGSYLSKRTFRKTVWREKRFILRSTVLEFATGHWG